MIRDNDGYQRQMADRLDRGFGRLGQLLGTVTAYQDRSIADNNSTARALVARLDALIQKTDDLAREYRMAGRAGAASGYVNDAVPTAA